MKNNSDLVYFSSLRCKHFLRLDWLLIFACLFSLYAHPCLFLHLRLNKQIKESRNRNKSECVKGEKGCMEFPLYIKAVYHCFKLLDRDGHSITRRRDKIDAVLVIILAVGSWEQAQLQCPPSCTVHFIDIQAAFLKGISTKWTCPASALELALSERTRPNSLQLNSIDTVVEVLSI